MRSLLSSYYLWDLLHAMQGLHYGSEGMVICMTMLGYMLMISLQLLRMQKLLFLISRNTTNSRVSEFQNIILMVTLNVLRLIMVQGRHIQSQPSPSLKLLQPSVRNCLVHSIIKRVLYVPSTNQNLMTHPYWEMKTLGSTGCLLVVCSGQ